MLDLAPWHRSTAPTTPVFGASQSRSRSSHGRMLKRDSSRARVPRPARSLGSVAIIGAGVAGLACARTLLDHGVEPVVYDKGRVPGGRLTSARSPGIKADMGAQYFTIRDERFGSVVRSWLDEGVVGRWEGRIRALPARGEALVDPPIQQRFVGTDSMSAVARRLAKDVQVHTSHRVDVVERRGGRYALAGTVAARGVTLLPRDEANEETLIALGEFDVLLVCLPSDQIHPLLRGVSPTLAEAAASVACDPCLAVAFSPRGDVLRDLPFDGLFFGRDGDEDRIFSWLARDSSKPKRTDRETWVVHAAPDWSRLHLRDAREAVERALLDEIADVLELPRFEATATTLRRWAFARPRDAIASEALFDSEARLGVGGDWTAGGRVEGAFLSGIALAQRVLGVV